MNVEEIAQRILGALLPGDNIYDEDVVKVAAIVGDALTRQRRDIIDTIHLECNQRGESWIADVLEAQI